MKPTMNLELRLSTETSGNEPRFTEEEIKEEFANDNVKIERTLLIRKSDNKIIGQFYDK
jgi:hypothetical protein